MKPILWIQFGAVWLSGKGLLGLENKMCSTGSLSVTEYSNVSLKCGQCSELISWFIGKENDQLDMSYIGSCNKTKCTVQKMFAFRLNTSRRKSHFDSILDIISIQSENILVVLCECYAYSSWSRKYVLDDSASCRLLIKVPPIVVPENCTVWISNWKVYGECLVTRMYTSGVFYKCTWSVNDAELPSAFQEPLSQNRSQSRTYMRDVCSFNQEMPSSPYNYTYKISIDPGPQNVLVQTMNIEPPEKPEINCSNSVLEGSTVTCMCTSLNTGNPPANFLWDGLNTDNLLLHNVQRQNSLTNYTCRQTWGPYGLINSTVNYTLTVSYGPSDVDIFIVTSENGTVTLNCMAIDVHPSAVFYWNISCDKEIHSINTSTCSFPTRDADDEIVVMCTATNTASKSSIVKTFIINDTSTKLGTSPTGAETSLKQGNEQTKMHTGRVNGGLIGGVVVGVVAIIVITVVIVVFIVKRRKEEFNSKRFTSRFWPCAFKFFHKKSPLSTPHAIVSKSENSNEPHAAPPGDPHTKAVTTVSKDVSGDYDTVCDTIASSVIGTDRGGCLMASQATHKANELRALVKPTIKPKPTAARTNNVQDTTAGSGYMNVTEVPTDSGLGVYHIVPWLTVSAQRETDTENGTAAVVSEDEYNVLSFEEDRSGQEDQAATYHHLEHE